MQIADRAGHGDVTPAPVDGQTSDGSSDRLRRGYEYHKAGHSIYKQRHLRSRRLVIVLGLACTVLTIVLISTVVARVRLASENRDLERIVDSLNYRLADLESRQRLPVPPDLMRIEYDRLVPLDNRYVKAIQVSSPVYSGGGIRFQLLVENQPSFVGATIEVFDSRGDFVSEISLDSELVETVDVGTTRSITGVIDGLDVRPSFFRISIL